MLYQGIIGGGSSPVEPVDLSPVLLWENTSPTSTFTPQKVSLDLTEYVGVIIEYNFNTSDTRLVSRLYCKKTDLFGETGVGFNSSSVYARRVLSVSNDGIEFGFCIGGSTQDNNTLIPVKIYGVKEYVVEPVGTLKTVTKTYGISVGTSLTDIGTTFDELSEIVGIVSYKSTDSIFINYNDSSKPIGLSFEGNKFIGYATRDVGVSTNITVTVTGYKA